jgi:adenylate cyclase
MSIKSAEEYEMKLGEVLLAKGLITQDQLQAALDEKRDRLSHLGHSAHIGQIMVEQGFIPEETLIDAINVHYGLNVTSLSENIGSLISSKRKHLTNRISVLRIPIWVQLILATTFIVALTTLALSYVFLERQEDLLYRETVNIGTVSLNYFANNARIPLLEDNILRLNTLIKEATAVKGLKYAFIIDNNNEIKAHSNLDLLGTTFKSFENIGQVVQSGPITYFNYATATDERILNLTRPVVFKDRELGSVHVGVSIDHIQATINRDRGYSIFTALFFMVFGILVAIILGIRFSGPIAKLVRATREIAKGNYRYKVDLKRNDELGDLAQAFNHMNEELLVKSLMQENFGKYVGKEILSMILDNPERGWLKGRRVEATVIFVDIRGFTPFAEKKEPEKLVERLNQYLGIATRVIRDHGGYVDKFIGDAVLGVFGVPVFYEGHRDKALRAAMDMQAQFESTRTRHNPLLKLVAIGIHSGVLIAGNIGSHGKLEYTVIGDSVNVAAHICDIAGPGEVVISDAVHQGLQNKPEAQALSPHRLKGRVEKVQTYRVLGYNG